MECNPLYSKDTPWGKWEVLLETKDCKVKRITVNPNKRLSYQTHKHREESWLIIKGIATVVLDGTESTHKPGDSIFIEKQAAHRIGNFGDEDVEFIEIQRGDYFGEDDIVRLQDDFGR